MTLQVHGRFTLFTFGQVLYSRPYDSWNLECAEAYIQAYKEALTDLAQHYSTYFLVVDLRYWQLGTHDTMRKLAEPRRIRAKMNKTGQIYFGERSVTVSVSEKVVAANEVNHFRVETLETTLAIMQQMKIDFEPSQLESALSSATLPCHALSPK